MYANKNQDNVVGGVLRSNIYPSESDTADGVAQYIGENGRPRVASREIGMEMGRVPVRHAGHNDRLDIVEYLLPRFALFGSLVGQQLANVTGSHCRQNGSAGDVVRAT